MTLYKVKVGIQMVVVTEKNNKKLAKEIALENALEEASNIDDFEILSMCEEIETIQDVPNEWRESIPWSSKDHNIKGQTCEQLLGAGDLKLGCEQCGYDANLFACRGCSNVYCSNHLEEHKKKCKLVQYAE